MKKLFILIIVCGSVFATSFVSHPVEISVTGTVGKMTSQFAVTVSNTTSQILELNLRNVKLWHTAFLSGWVDLNPYNDVTNGQWYSIDYDQLPTNIALPFEYASFDGMRSNIIIAPYGLLLFDDQPVHSTNCLLPNENAPGNCWAIGWYDYQLTPTSAVEWCVLSNKVAIYYTGLLEPTPGDSILSPVVLRSILYPDGSILLDHDCYEANKTIGWQESTKQHGQSIVALGTNYFFFDGELVGMNKCGYLPLVRDSETGYGNFDAPSHVLPYSVTQVVCSVSVATNSLEPETEYIAFSPHQLFYPFPNTNTKPHIRDIELMTLKIYKGTNTPPVLSGMTNVLLDTEPFTIQYIATDINGDSLAFSTMSTPPNATMNSYSGILDCSETAKGDYDCTVKVIDDGFPRLSDTLDVHISIVPEPVGVFLLFSFWFAIKIFPTEKNLKK